MEGQLQLQIFLYLAENVQNGCFCDFCDRKVARETGVPYQRVRTIHRKWAEQCGVEGTDAPINLCELEIFSQLKQKIDTLSRFSKESERLKESERPKGKLEQKRAEMLKRREAFKAELSQYLDLYGRDVLNAFWGYWTEPNKSQTKMRFELQKTWDMERRLITWEKRDADRRKQS